MAVRVHLRSSLSPADGGCVEAVRVVSVADPADLPEAAVRRIGLKPGQVNVLVRVVLRHPVRTLTRAEANHLRNAIYAALHQGSQGQWAT